MENNQFKRLDSTIYEIKFNKSKTGDDYSYYEKIGDSPLGSGRVPFFKLNLVDFPEISFHDLQSTVGENYIPAMSIQKVAIKELFTGFKMKVDIHIPYQYYQKYKSKSYKRTYEKTVWVESTSERNKETGPFKPNYVEAWVEPKTIEEEYEYINFLDILTEIGQRFYVQFGWNAGSRSYLGKKGFQVVLFRSNMKFDPENRGLNLSLTLGSIYDNILGSISVSDLNLNKVELESKLTANEMFEYILEASRSYATKYRGSLNNKLRGINPIDDIPKVSQIKYSLYSSSDINDEGISPEVTNSIAESMREIITKSDDTLTVYDLFNRSCFDNDFMIRFTPLSDKRIRISNITNSLTSVVRKLYEPNQSSINEDSEVFLIYEYDFDVFSKSSNFISLNIEAEAGSQSIASVKAASQFGTNYGSDLDFYKNNNKEKALKAINSYYDQWLLTSKKLSAEMIGNPSVDLWDLYKMNFYDKIKTGDNKLFSGYYSVLEIIHEFSPGVYTTRISAVKIANKIYVDNLEKLEVEAPNIVESLEDSFPIIEALKLPDEVIELRKYKISPYGD